MAQENEKEDIEPKISFRETEYIFGEIEEGKKVEHTFAFENSGTKPLFISAVVSTCGCVVAEFPQKPVTKGQTENIKVTFDSAEKIGQQAKTLIIQSNAVNGEIKLKIKGNVISEKSEGSN